MKDFIFFVLIFIGAVSFAIWGFALNNELKEKKEQIIINEKAIINLEIQMKSDSTMLSNYQQAAELFLNNYPSEYMHFQSIMEKLETE